MHADGQDMYVPQQKVPARESEYDGEPEGQGGEKSSQGSSQGGIQGGTQDGNSRRRSKVFALVAIVGQVYQPGQHSGDFQSDHDDGRWNVVVEL